MKPSPQSRNQHLLSRAAFGVSLADLPGLGRVKTHKLLQQLFRESESAPEAITIRDPFVAQTLAMETEQPPEPLSKEEQQAQKKQAAKAINRQSNDDIRQMTVDWLDQMAFSKARLREKMALFWHGHFASRVQNSVYQQQLLDVIRKNALGSFQALLTEVSKSASMLSFLNNQQNRKKHPNENFAREVMELFTLGRGHYTEKDVKEAARAFTGWQYERNGSFRFNEKAHDDSSKTVLGQTGAWNGDDVLGIILKQRQAAIFLTEKIYRYFVNEQVQEAHIAWLSARFYENGYHIGKLMEDIFSADWFYDTVNTGNRFKSPVEYLTGIRTLLPMKISNPEVQILLQRLLGQWLFNPPNVAGWPGGKAWIDSSSLMLRLKIPSLIQEEQAIDLKPKSNDDVQMGKQETLPVGAGRQQKKAGSRYQIIAGTDWTRFTKELNEKDKTELFRKLKSILLQTPDGTLNDDTLLAHSGQDDLIQFTRRITIALMSTPEYQLC